MPCGVFPTGIVAVTPKASTMLTADERKTPMNNKTKNLDTLTFIVISLPFF
jgi:hypothetical protein